MEMHKCRPRGACPFPNEEWTKWVYPPLFQTKVGGGKMQTSSPPVITPNRSQSNPNDMITLPRPIQAWAWTCTMFRARLRAGLCRGKEGLNRAPTFVRQFGGYTHICYYFYPPPTIVHFFIHFCPKYTLTTLRLSKGGLKRQSLLQTWCGSAPRRGPSANGYDAWRFGSCCCLKKNLNAPRPSEHPPVRGKKCQNV